MLKPAIVAVMIAIPAFAWADQMAPTGQQATTTPPTHAAAHPAQQKHRPTMSAQAVKDPFEPKMDMSPAQRAEPALVPAPQ